MTVIACVFIVVMAALALSAYVNVLEGMNDSNLAILTAVGIPFIVLLIVLMVLDKVLYKRNRIFPFLFVPVFPLLIIYLFIKSNLIDGSIVKSDVLLFSGEYLTFIGTFCLGYFIYLQDVNLKIGEKRKKVEMLILEINNSEIALIKLKELYESDAFEEMEMINYNVNWYSWYLEYESLDNCNHNIKYTIRRFFSVIDKVNYELKNGNLKRAMEIYEESVADEMYSIEEYNMIESITCLMDSCCDYRMMDTTSWIKRKENIDKINRIAREYYVPVEGYIYDLLTNKKQPTNPVITNRQIVDWLINTYPNIKGMLKGEKDKRIVAKSVVDCALKMEEKSEIVGYVWGEFYLKQKNDEGYYGKN